MEKIKPLIIVMTPVRNEAWVLKAFLETTSTWADYIIIADQMSTDGSRDIIKEYANKNGRYPDKADIILIDNKNPNFNEAERQAMLVAKAREISAGRDTILFGLDADEIFAANFKETEDWKKILDSIPRDVFWFKWAEISPNKKQYGDSVFYPWMFHDDGKEPHGNYVRAMHSMRIPYPIDEKQMYYVNDFRVLHLAYLNPSRVLSKCRFYMLVDWELNNRTCIELARSYNYNKHLEEFDIKDNFFLYEDYNLLNDVDTTSTKHWFDEYILERYSNDLLRIAHLDIWNKDFIEAYNLTDPRKWYHKLLHCYLHKTQKYKSNIIVRGIDKILKKVVR